MPRRLLFVTAIFISLITFSQGPPPAVIDSFKQELANAKTDRQRFDYLGYLAKVLMNVNPAEAEKYGQQMIMLAETSRDRQMMVDAQLINGERYSYLAGQRSNIETAIRYYNKGLALAKASKLEVSVVRALLSLSEVNRSLPALEEALNFCNQAYSYSGSLNNDSLVTRVHLEYGSVYLARNEKLLALRHLLTAIRTAESLKDNGLLRAGYSRLSNFYSAIEDYDRAIDYLVKSMNLIDLSTGGQSPYQKVQDLNRIGDLYARKKDYAMASSYYEQSLALAEQLKFEPLKVLSYRSIVNNYIDSDQPQKALDYFNAHPQLKEFLKAVNFGHFIDQSYGYIFTRLGNYDSAKYYYRKVAPFFEGQVNINNQFSYYSQLGTLFTRTRENDSAIHYFLKAKAMADKTGNLELMSYVSTMLDSAYRRKGNFEQALNFASLHNMYKDSLNVLGKEKDLMQLEAADEQQRQERIASEQAEKKRRRNNIQYLAITIGIVALFLFLVVLGMFKVSANTIRMIGFFAFIMFFEFIFLIFKKNIYGITKGEPWKDLMFMIALAAVLLPLHHWLEEKVIHYLTSHNRLTTTGTRLKMKFLKKEKIQ